MKSLSDYLNIEDTVKFIKEVTKVPFFNEGNLFDLVVKKEIQPIIYFDGYGSTWRNKLYSPYPEDFENINEWSGGVEYSAQSNHVKGYFYILHGEAIMNSKNLITHRRFIIQNLVDYQIIPDYSLPNRGSNSKGDIFRRTSLYVADHILLSTENPKDEIIDPCFKKDDIKFYILDLINMLERNGYYSADENQQADKVADDKVLSPKDSAYHLIAVLKDLLLDPNTTPYMFKTDNHKSTNQPTQAGLAEHIDAMNLKGLKARNINGMFSDANRLLNDLKKY